MLDINRHFSSISLQLLPDFFLLLLILQVTTGKKLEVLDPFDLQNIELFKDCGTFKENMRH